MSTKIYQAWRCRLELLTESIMLIREHCLRTVSERVAALAAHVSDKPIREIYNEKRWSKEMTEEEFFAKRGAGIRTREVFKAALQASISVNRNPVLCIDCELAIWIRGEFALIMPIGESWIFRSLPEWRSSGPDGNLRFIYENYAYWNNTDRPHDVTEDDWNKRGADWSATSDATLLRHRIVLLKEDGFGCLEVARMVIPDKQDAFRAAWGIDEPASEEINTDSI